MRIASKIYASPVHVLEPGTLFIVPTPLGNLEDLSLRVIRILHGVDWIAAEDTRHTGLLLSRLGIKKQLFSSHQFNESGRSRQLVDLLASGQKGALVTDAGTPGISDPGQKLVRNAADAGIKIMPLPGPCAVPTAISGSGFPCTEFHFAGFLPMKSGARLRKMQALSAHACLIVLYESPHKMPRFLDELAQVFPNNPVVIGRELTKKFEEFIRGSGSEIHQSCANRSWKGELVIVIDNSNTDILPPHSPAPLEN